MLKDLMMRRVLAWLDAEERLDRIIAHVRWHHRGRPGRLHFCRLAIVPRPQLKLVKIG